MGKRSTILGWEQLGKSKTAIRRNGPRNSPGSSARFKHMTLKELTHHCDVVLASEFTLDGCDSQFVAFVCRKVLHRD